ncbi:MAG: flippase-like domain-containing protein [Bacteroides sp.]|nr:flippase-like domain-containing protein [Bacteroides sp.]
MPDSLRQDLVEESDPKAPLTKRILAVAVRYLLPLALTILLVWYMFRKISFGEMMEILRHGVDYWWILCAMAISVFSHIFRAMRWRIQLRALDINAPLMALSCSVFGCYALNLVFPRLGEVWRCTYIASRQKAPFTKVLGSMVADRLADTLTVASLLLLCFIVAAPAINAFLTRYPVGRDIIALISNPWLWVALVVAGIAGWWALRRFRNAAPVRKLLGMLAQLWQGFAVVTSMPGKWRFLMLTLCIWGCYFLQLYVAFFAFPFTRDLCAEPGLAWGLTPCLVAFVLSSIGMAIPSNGGLGPWNIAVMFGLAIYGISDPQGTAFSMLQWSGQTVMLILLGIFTMVYISVSGSKNRASRNG